MTGRNQRQRPKRSRFSRRVFLQPLSSLLVPFVFRPRNRVYASISRPNDIRIVDVSCYDENYRYRAPYKFGGREVDRVTLLNVRCVVGTASGRTAHGFGSMTMGNVWAFPSEKMSYDKTLEAMKALAELIRKITMDFKDPGHPIDITTALEPEYLKAADEVSRRLRLEEPVPKLCTLVTASPFDAALHDAFGKVHGVSSYHTYGSDFMAHDLAHYLGPEFEGEYLAKYVLREPQARLALYHSVGASDPVEQSDIRQRINDGLPETLPEWIRYNGVRCIKIKLNGDDLAWDLERVVRIDRATREAQRERGVKNWVYSLDFNERCHG